MDFQYVINGLLGGLQFEKVLKYMEDLLIPSKAIERGLKLLGEVLGVDKADGS